MRKKHQQCGETLHLIIYCLTNYYCFMPHTVKTKMFIIKYWKSLLALLIILYLSFASPSTFKDIPTFRHADKVVHFLMYAFFSSVLVYDFHNDNVVLTSKISFILTSLILPILIGGTIELLQSSVFRPRSAEWLDWLFDTAGIIAGFLFTSVLLYKMKDINSPDNKKENNG